MSANENIDKKTSEEPQFLPLQYKQQSMKKNTIEKVLPEESENFSQRRNIENLEFIDLFAGIGGLRQAFDAYGDCVFSAEKDQHAQISYKLIYGDKPEGDITKIAPKDIPNHDLLLAGFPCQAFSIAGYRQGFDDEKGRGNLFFNIVDILKEKHPETFLLENVKNLRGHDGGRTFQTICHHLTALGYGIRTEVLNAKYYGLHQNRERIYIIGKKDAWIGNPISLPTKDNVLTEKELSYLLTNSKNNKIANFPLPPTEKFIPLDELGGDIGKTTKITVGGLEAEYHDPPSSLERYFQKYDERTDWDKYLYNEKDGHFLKAVQFINGKIKGAHNTEKFDNLGSNNWSDIGYQYIYQWRRKYVRRNEGGVCPTLTANMGTGGHNVPLIICGTIGENKLIRKLTPEECALFQGFSREFALKLGGNKMSNGQKYKQIGNSVPVTVVNKLAEKMMTQFWNITESYDEESSESYDEENCEPIGKKVLISKGSNILYKTDTFEETKKFEEESVGEIIDSVKFSERFFYKVSLTSGEEVFIDSQKIEPDDASNYWRLSNTQ